jgi:NDP-sugar pyrophosphorylase family protein
MMTTPILSKAMVLAAGEGTRLRPLTLTTPKAMVPIGGRPLLAHTLAWLKKYGITEIGINLHYLGQNIIDYFGDGAAYGLKITYSQEPALLGTAGGVKKLESLFHGSRFAVIYADVLAEFDLNAMATFHFKNGSFATLALSSVPNPNQKGIVELDNQSRILNFTEKPLQGTEKSNLASGGIYILEPEVLDYIPSTGPADFGFDIFPALLNQGRPLYGYVLPPSAYLLDIGSLEKYRQANEDYPRLKSSHFPLALPLCHCEERSDEAIRSSRHSRVSGNLGGGE